ncbi:N-acetylmuramoyl-L-alanine amidase [Achromobacter aegrifaciens]|uniref:N-acetylmuramoyl-L-alanine amidase n=1 Tax=Achromobacter aegrifaciens TaxID=1287736 RepID=UPI000F7486CF|nr:N-acetylmuramoyl-L-alanine amidase [Achromobacter aegrifaciens]RSE98171.1 N-acetylmuramoyl-L-alanine amidase [Achromobacter aegrifaciens]
MRRLFLAPLAAAILAGCAARGPAGLDLDTSITAVSQASRVRSIVLHYTSVDDARSMELLSKGKVSSHYLVNDAGRVYQLVDENRAAWHAGASSWYGNIAMNSTSIGIEIVNPGWTEGSDGKPVWHPYNDQQLRALTILLRDIAQRHGVTPENIVGHSDIAPQRKVDPGPLFPWKTLAEAGIGRWYDETGAAEHLARLQVQGIPDVAWFQKQLARLGYACPQDGTLSPATIGALAAFQMHYRPTLYDGQPDAETAAIMLAML